MELAKDFKAVVITKRTEVKEAILLVEKLEISAEQ